MPLLALLVAVLTVQSDAPPAIFAPSGCPFQAVLPGPFITSRLPENGALATRSGPDGRRAVACTPAFRDPEATPCQDVRRLTRRIEAARPRARARWLEAWRALCAREVVSGQDAGGVERHVVGAAGAWVFMIEETLVAETAAPTRFAPVEAAESRPEGKDQTNP